MRHLVNGVVAVLSIGAFVLALYLAYHEKVAAAGVCIAAAILPILFNQLPFVESFAGSLVLERGHVLVSCEVDTMT